jgi:hypothetical protein
MSNHAPLLLTPQENGDQDDTSPLRTFVRK